MKLMKLSLTVCVAALLAGSCFAPILGKPEGKEFHGELSQSELAKHQSSTGVVKGSGGGPSDVPSQSRGSGGSDKDAAKAVSQSISTSSAGKTLDQATNDVEDGKPGSTAKNMMFGGFFVLLGLGIAFGVREYLNRVVPDAPGRL